MRQALQALTRVDVAISCATTDRRHRILHLEAAIHATGDLQRALILERLHLDHQPTRAHRAPQEQAP
jgi:hypothetical protein